MADNSVFLFSFWRYKLKCLNVVMHVVKVWPAGFKYSHMTLAGLCKVFMLVGSLSPSLNVCLNLFFRWWNFYAQLWAATNSNMTYFVTNIFATSVLNVVSCVSSVYWSFTLFEVHPWHSSTTVKPCIICLFQCYCFLVSITSSLTYACMHLP